MGRRAASGWRGCRCCWAAPPATPGCPARTSRRRRPGFARRAPRVEVIGHPGERHDISARQRLRARALILGARRRCRPRRLRQHARVGGAGGRAARPAEQSPTPPPSACTPSSSTARPSPARRADNRRTWCYRIRPASQRRAFVPLAHPRFGAAFEGRPPEINLTGFAPLPAPDEPRDFLDGLRTVAGAGSPALRRGCAIHLYCANRDMDGRAFYDADGDLLLVPELGALTVLTELGPLEVAPGQIAALAARAGLLGVPARAARARVRRREPSAAPSSCPNAGRSGANGLADARHFRAPDRLVRGPAGSRVPVVAKLGRPPAPGQPGPLAVRRGRLAGQPPAVRLRPGRLLAGGQRRASTTPTRDLHGALGAARRTGRAHPGSDRLSPALGRHAGDLPPALLSPQPGQRGERHRARVGSPRQPVSYPAAASSPPR